MKAGEYVLLTVRDSGHGMAQETMEHIFEPFYTTKVVGQGTGLGLAIAKAVVEAHGGTIGATSQLKHGSVFYFNVPV